MTQIAGYFRIQHRYAVDAQSARRLIGAAVRATQLVPINTRHELGAETQLRQQLLHMRSTLFIARQIDDKNR